MPLIRQSLLSALVPALALACSDATSPSTPITALPRQLTVAEQHTVDAGNAFSFALFRQLAKTQAGQNVFVSPVSVSMSLGMTMNGARGTTLDAMRTTLGVGPGDLAQINAGYTGLIDLLRGLDPTSTFQIANSIWYRNTFVFNQSFLDTTAKWFDAKVQGLNFADATGSLATINAWVTASTNGTIPTILDHISDDEVMFLINAIYFKGAWQLKFDPALTTPQPFHAADGTTQTVPMMSRGEYLVPKVRRSNSSSLSMLELPYGNGAFAMDIVIPGFSGGFDGSLAGIDSVAASLDASTWAQLVAGLRDDEPAVILPKFTLQYDRTLNDDLTALGMGIAFSDSADFSAMSSSAILVLEFVKQKAYVDVNEEGTEAGASTVTGVIPVSLDEFRVDRPFIFVIRERLTGTILFMGKVLRIP